MKGWEWCSSQFPSRAQFASVMRRSSEAGQGSAGEVAQGGERLWRVTWAASVEVAQSCRRGSEEAQVGRLRWQCRRGSQWWWVAQAAHWLSQNAVQRKEKKTKRWREVDERITSEPYVANYIEPPSISFGLIILTKQKTRMHVPICLYQTRNGTI